MPFNGAGVFQRLYSWVNDAANNIKISSTRMDAEMNGMATALSDCVTRDGQSPWTTNLPAGGFKLTNLGAGSGPGDSVRYEQVGLLANPNTWSAQQTVAVNVGGYDVCQHLTNNSSTGAAAIFFQNDVGRLGSIGFYGSNFGGNLLGNIRANRFIICADEIGTTGEPVSLLIGAAGQAPIGLGTNDVIAITISGSTQKVQFNTYGAGTLVTDANGNITASSDRRLKDVHGEFSAGLNAIQRLEPKLYHWNGGSDLDTTHTYAGFVAQDVQSVIPEAVSEGPDGYLGLSDRPIIAALVNAVKELAARIQALEMRQ